MPTVTTKRMNRRPPPPRFRAAGGRPGRAAEPAGAHVTGCVGDVGAGCRRCGCGGHCCCGARCCCCCGARCCCCCGARRCCGGRCCGEGWGAIAGGGVGGRAGAASAPRGAMGRPAAVASVRVRPLSGWNGVAGIDVASPNCAQSGDHGMLSGSGGTRGTGGLDTLSSCASATGAATLADAITAACDISSRSATRGAPD